MENSGAQRTKLFTINYVSYSWQKEYLALLCKHSLLNGEVMLTRPSTCTFHFGWILMKLGVGGGFINKVWNLKFHGGKMCTVVFWVTLSLLYMSQSTYFFGTNPMECNYLDHYRARSSSALLQFPVLKVPVAWCNLIFCPSKETLCSKSEAC